MGAIQLPLIHEPPAFCAYAGGPCDQDFREIAAFDGLFLFASEPKGIASTITQAANALNERTDGRWQTWKDMNIAGRLIFCEICKSIRGAGTVYADVTTLNFNLLFEIGFAIGLGVAVRPIRDTTYQIDAKLFRELGVLDTLGYIDFTNRDNLAGSVLSAGPAAAVAAPPARTYRDRPLYVLQGPIDTDGVVRLLSLLKKSRLGFRTHDPRETPRLPLHNARRQVSGSFGVIAHLLSPHRDGAVVHNALCSLICGMAVAEGKPVVMLQEEEVQQPIDYRDLVKTYETPDQIDRLLEEPLTQVVERLQHDPLVSRQASEGILSVLDLGDVAAENEIRGLREYFVRTGRFQQVRQGHAQLVVGRKGAGKTAMFYGLREAVQRGKEILVLDMKPEGHQFTRLREAVLSELTSGQQEYTIAAFWTYLLSAEVAHKILNYPPELLAAERDPERYAAYKALQDAYLSHGLASGDDFPQRLLRQIDRIAGRFAAESKITERSDLTELVYGGDIRTLNDAVAAYISREKDEVWLLIDNLDKSWATRGSTAEDMLIMRGLLDAAQRLQRLLDDRDVEFRVVVFIRTDIYEHLTERTPDRGKETMVSLDWDDAELFREIVRQRIVASTDLDGTFAQVWANIGPALIGIEDTFGYLLDRTFLRPRDLLLFLDAAVQVAIDRGHDRLSVEDIQQAEARYSDDMLLSLSYEIEDTHPDASAAIYAFQGAAAVLRPSETQRLLEQAGLSSVDDQIAALELLLWYGFLGVRAPGSDEELFSYKIGYNMRRLKHAVATEQGRYVVHPGLRTALSVT